MFLTLLVAAMAVTATDQTVQVTKGTKLTVNNFSGDVNVKTWDKDAVRVQADHSDREVIDIKPVDQTLTIRSRSTRGGPPRSLDYTITVPTWMGVNISGTYADVTADGVGGDVTVETTHGDITIKGGSGVISLKSLRGTISLEKAKGRIEIRAMNEGIRLADISGDLSAESTNGSIVLDRVDSSNVDLYTVNGSISYDGPIKDQGLYRLTTHNGLVALAIPERANITLSARTYNGSIRASFPLPGGDPNNERRSRRTTLTVGNGSAHIELESFSGNIALRRPNEPRPDIDQRRRDRGDARQMDEKTRGKMRDELKEMIKAPKPPKTPMDLDLDLDVDVDHVLQNVLPDVMDTVDAVVRDAMQAFGTHVPQPPAPPRPPKP